MTARRALLDGLARGADVFEVLSGLEPLHPRNDTFPGGVFLHLAGDALAWCGASRADPLPLEGLRERFLPDCAFRGRQNTKLQYAVLAAAAVHGGTEPDLLDEFASWQTDDFWPCHPPGCRKRIVARDPLVTRQPRIWQSVGVKSSERRCDTRVHGVFRASWG
jgi:hypothetical protein